MPKLPLRTSSVRKSPAAPSRGRADTPVHRSSSSARPRPSQSPPRHSSLRPPSTLRSRSHEADRYPADSSSSRRDSRRDSYARPAAPRRRSTHRSSISPHSRHASRDRRDHDRRPSSSDRRPSHRRRESYSPSPDRQGSSSGGRESRDRVRFDDSGRRGRPVSPMSPPSRNSNAASPLYQSGGSMQQPAFAPATPVPGYGAPGQDRLAPGRPSRSGSSHRAVTPPKYKPQGQTPSPAVAATAGARAGSAAKAQGAPPPSDPKPKPEPVKTEPPKPAAPASPPSPKGGSAEKLAGMFGSVPGAFMAYHGVKELKEHAGTAKEWVDWLKDLGETPEEIDELSAKATTARDTISQIQAMLKSRPDLLEDDAGEKLKEQIEDNIKETDKTLGKMTKMLSELSKNSAKEGTMWSGLQDFWNSYQYKNEWEDKIKAADDDLQKNLASLSTLMVNVNTRALMKPAPPPAPAQAPIEPVPAATDTSKEATSEKLKSPPPTTAAATIAGTAPPTTAPQTVPEAVGPLLAAKAAARGSTSLDQADTEDVSPKSPPEPALGTAKGERPPTPDTVAEAEKHVGFDLSTEANPPNPRDTMPTPPPNLPSTAGAPPPLAVPTKDGTTPPPVLPSKITGPPLVPAPEARRESVASITSNEDAQDALLDAAWEGDLDAVARALRRAPVTSCDTRGLTALHLASERDNLAVAIMLLDRGADVHARANGGRMPLHLASRFASAETVEMLLERAKADPNAKTSDGRTPLHYAASSAEDGKEDRREVIRVLRDFGADPTAEDRKGETPRDVAQKRDFWDAAATLRRAERKWNEDHHQNWLQRHGFSK